jgi:pilus assembly protein Flp/PilA
LGYRFGPSGAKPLPHSIIFQSKPFHLQKGDPAMKNLAKRLWKEEEGQDLTEYALLVVLIALVAIASMQTLGHAISDAFASASTNLTTT